MSKYFQSKVRVLDKTRWSALNGVNNQKLEREPRGLSDQRTCRVAGEKIHFSIPPWCASMLRSGLFAAVMACARAGPAAQKFGIGVYGDTPGSPELAIQLVSAAKLNGEGGWVTLYLCSWRTDNASCVNASTPSASPSDIELLQQAYSLNQTVVVRVGYPHVPRDHSDDGEHLHYQALAKAYSRIVASLPAPPRGQPLYVNVGNEFNACNEWRCSEKGGNITAAKMAEEVAGFYTDVSSALVSLRDTPGYGHLRVAHGALAEWQMTVCACNGSKMGYGQPGLVFLQGMLAARPGLFDHVDWLSSHAYPYSAPWGDPKAHRGLTYYRNESAAVGRPGLPVVVTETGWRREDDRGIGDAQQANWTSLAYEKVWLPDAQVVGVTPFLLAGKFWEGLGWPYVDVEGENLIPRAVYNATRRIRCATVGGVDCDGSQTV